MKQKTAENIVGRLIEIVSENVLDIREQKELFLGVIDLFIDDLGVDQLKECLGESDIFDKQYLKYIQELEDDGEETEELDFDDE
mgnify:FL=1